MSKERLETAKLMARMLRVETRLPHDFPFDLVDWLVEQAERVQELERQNKRYREYLELIRKTGALGKVISSGEIILSDEAELANEALEGEE